MSERMSELLWQAGGYTKLDGSYSLHESHLQKFAELIVRECSQYLNSPEFIGRSDLDWSMVLNEHFGVEE
jgi:hypothetical protein